MIKKSFEYIYLGCIFIFLYAPIVALSVLSFNESKYMSKWGGFSLKWYKTMFNSNLIMSALQNTLIIAVISALIATIIGTLACIGINHMRSVSRTVIMGITNVPMLNADIVTGISLMLCFIAFGITLSMKTVIIAHITFNIPYVILSVMPKLKQTERSTYEAALDLGASPVYAFFKVVFPDILPGIVSGFLLAFTMSLDDFIITHFTKGAGINTISTLVYGEVRKGIKPSLYALSTLMFLAVLVLLFIMNYSQIKRKEDK
ncbi:Spermidine Putrescine ABC transporter permease component potC [Lachnospiraceae bacterium TWA4]|nr:Spermidine Putrescine ABC transporter permease component potC [Lachnospiraceae bacterium TWA4]